MFQYTALKPASRLAVALCCCAFLATTVSAFTDPGDGNAQPAANEPAANEPAGVNVKPSANKSGQDAVRGIRPVNPDGEGNAQKGYRKSWALIIGINYIDPTRTAADRLSLPILKNAEQDAASVAELLKKHYGYTDKELQLISGKEATYQLILDKLAEFSDETKVHKDDSVFVFFAGHGGRLEGETRDRGAIYPYDVKFANGRPNSRYLALRNEVVNRLQKSPARHKLIVLDSCHSGEIFSAAAQPRSETDDRHSTHLFTVPALQAIASCRASQVASDGRNGNSPFTNALLQAMRQLPAREQTGDRAGEKNPVWTNRLFRYMRSELSSLPNGQSPDCRNLSSGDGEFYFYPQGDFSEYGATGSDFRLLQAMVPGEHGNWWFDETPWFMPSLRRMILDEQADARSSLQGLAIRGDNLRELAERAMRRLQAASNDKGSVLNTLRLAHLKIFLRGDGQADFQKQVTQIVTDLTAAGDVLEATDIHYLAAAQHRLRMPEALETYQRSLAKYAEEREAAQAKTPGPLEALCHSDRGQYLLEVKGDSAGAAQDFERARTMFDTGAPAAFRVYVLCREADSWQRRNRWGEANRKLLEALDVANNFDANHGLTSFALRRRAWAFMEQWRINEAQEAFTKANEILAALATSSDISAVDKSADPSEDPFAASDDYDGLIAYLHNLHGLAMAKRFQGDGVGAASEYRQLTGRISLALGRLRQNATSSRAATDVEGRLIDRLINTQERLADCNLFGNPEISDVKEAADDLRRAMGICHLTRGGDQVRVGLLYKRALALCLPSDCQDIELARAYCAEASDLYKKNGATAGALIRTLSELCPPIVGLYELDSDTLGDDATRAEALMTLRTTILKLRGNVGQNIHRDQLELLLFAGRILVEALPTDDRYHMTEDAELLLSLCRFALPKNAESEVGEVGRQETREYLRPYYDAVMRAKLRLVPKHVKDLLEVQWEATRGESYLKPQTSVAVLAIYMLDGKCYVFLDAPRGVSKHFCLDGDFDLPAIRTASTFEQRRLVLPREVTRELDKLREGRHLEAVTAPGTKSEPVVIECWWRDPVRGIGAESLRSAGVPNERTTEKPVRGEFPFVAPTNIEFTSK